MKHKQNEKSRRGRHKEDKTLLGAYVTPEIKALAVMTADRLGITLTDILLNGLKSEAARAGILRNDEIVPEHRAAYDAIVEMVRVANAERKRAK